MKIKAVSGIMLTLLLTSMLTLTFNIQLVKAGGTIHIRADGSVDPSTANITSVDNVTYTFTADMNESIVVEKDNIVVDGAGYTVQGTGSGTGITLSGRSNVTIKNMEIKAFNYGIQLLGSSNNSISRNNITANNRHGIRLYQSSYNNVYENKITNSKYYGSFYGILLEQSSNNSVSGNKITNYPNGVQLHSSLNNIICGNNITANSLFGIELYNSPSNVLRDNVMAGNKYNFWIWGIELLHYMNDVDASNTVDGRTIFYVVNEQNLIIEPQTYPNVGYLAAINSTNMIIRHQKMENNHHGILLVYTENSLIQNVTAVNNYYGIRLMWSSNNTISTTNLTTNDYGISLDWSSNYNSIQGNNITNNKVCGIKLSDSSNNDIYGNFVTNNSYGIEFRLSSKNTISINNISNNYRHGVWLIVSSDNTISGNNITNNYDGVVLSGASNNSIYHNNFINNTQQVYERTDDPSYDLPSINIWDNGYPSGGNYWSDHTFEDQDGDGVCDAPYVIDENNQDNYPLMSPTWSPKPPEEVPFWMQWWFWAIVIAGIVVLTGAVYFLKKRKPLTPTAPPIPSEETV